MQSRLGQYGGPIGPSRFGPVAERKTGQ